MDIAGMAWAKQGKPTVPKGAAGFGVVKFDKTKRSITFACYPRNVDVADPNVAQYPGWPKTIRQADNYARKAAAWLPTIAIEGAANPVVQVVHEATGEIVYTLRIQGSRYRPKVFAKGKYTIHVGEGKNRKTLKGISSLDESAEKIIVVEIPSSRQQR